MTNQEIVLKTLNRELDHEILDIKDNLNDPVQLEPEQPKYLGDILLGLLQLTKDYLNNHYSLVKERAESVFLIKKTQPKQINDLVYLIHNFVIDLSATFEDLIGNCYLTHTNLDLNLNNCILNSMQKSYAVYLNEGR